MADDEPRCEHTDLLVSQCHHCRRKADGQTYFDAMYEGDCATCDMRIEVGQRIRERPDGRWEHARHR